MSDRLLKESDVIEAFKGREPLIHDVYTATAIIRSVPSAERGLYMKFSTARKRMLKIIDELEKQCIDYYKAGEEAGRTKDIPSAETPQWIPCSERLPEEKEGVYLICTDGGYMCSCRWTNVNLFWTDLTTAWHWNIVDIPQYSKVVAWMELEPWEGANDERSR